MVICRFARNICMDLKEYIENSLYSIISAVGTVQENVIDMNVIICPSTIKDDYLDGNGKQKLMNIKFDVAVTVGSSSESKNGIGIKVVEFISGEIKKTDTSNNQSISRIAFDVPIAMPVLDKLDIEARKKQQENMKMISTWI